MTDERKDGLDSFFDAGRAQAPEPSRAFMASLQAQALAEMPAPRAVSRRPGVLTQLRQALGGWPGAAGLAAAGLAGLWIGVSPPAGLAAMIGGTDLSGYAVDPIGSLELSLMAEG
ncbi:hypothetical protein KUH32_01750 [Thalassococcus sp. CAU 1522]|uniref:Dihydroorotate dehydrogenase n=1 Tax=Thalassococcus arenae TaxID=2851652 RepID=A0ABS6N395_9RHOB|nr:hypothetical protein [Thalassococcus arenae]MBV2358486.1 hypothetical protein [Thalassococcus arenae]